MRETNLIEIGWREFVDGVPNLLGGGADVESLMTPDVLAKFSEMAFYAGAHCALIASCTAGGKLQEIDGQKARVYEDEDVRQVVAALKANLHETLRKAGEFGALFSEVGVRSVN